MSVQIRDPVQRPEHLTRGLGKLLAGTRGSLGFTILLMKCLVGRISSGKLGDNWHFLNGSFGVITMRGWGRGRREREIKAYRS